MFRQHEEQKRLARGSERGINSGWLSILRAHALWKWEGRRRNSREGWGPGRRPIQRDKKVSEEQRLGRGQDVGDLGRQPGLRGQFEKKRC